LPLPGRMMDRVNTMVNSGPTAAGRPVTFGSVPGAHDQTSQQPQQAVM
jgi:hypothetical protein